MQVPSSPTVTVATGSSNCGRSNSQSSSGPGPRCHGVGDVLHVRASHHAAVVLLEVGEDSCRAELGVLVGNHLGEPRSRADHDPSLLIERAKRLAAPRGLVDMPLHRGHPIGGLIVLGQLAHRGELHGADLDRLPIGVEPLEGLLGGDDARLVEGREDGVLRLEHRVLQRDLDLDDEGGVGAADDDSHGGGSGWKEERPHYNRQNREILHESTATPCRMQHKHHYRTVRRFTFHAIAHSVGGVTRSMCPGRPAYRRPKDHMGISSRPKSKVTGSRNQPGDRVASPDWHGQGDTA